MVNKFSALREDALDKKYISVNFEENMMVFQVPHTFL